MKHLHLTLILLFSLYFSAVAAGGDSDFERTDDATHLPAMLLVDGEDVDSAISRLEAMGVTVLYHRDNILLTYIPVDSELLHPSGNDGHDMNGTEPRQRTRSGVKDIRISRPRQNQPTMREARKFNDAFRIAEGLNLPQPYDGKGVVVGVCDIGIDTRHPNFLSEDGTECRIRRVVHYQEQQGLRTEYVTPQEIHEWRTDNPDDWHATHVTGIAAGGFLESGYYSLAPKADIVFTASQLSDVGLLAGVEDIIAYAKSVGKPAVINLSMGNYVGPHDGTSLFTQYLDKCADDAIICLSAGNEGAGGAPVSMSFDFTESQKELRVLPNNWNGMQLTGIAEVWSPDDTPFDFSFYWNNNTTFANRIDAYAPLRASDGETLEWNLSLDPEDEDYDETFASLYREGYVSVSAGISPLNGRYCATLEFSLKTDIYHADTKWAEYWPGIKIEGLPGTHVDIYCGGGSFLRQERGFPAPDNRQCISDLATGLRTISVGMMNNTDVKEGMEPGSGYTKGDVCIHSGYGTLLDGRKMPLTVAPGAYVVSSISSAFLENHPEELQNVTDETDFNGGKAYWMGTIGTSMSCPFVVGAIATWLQAYPRLTPEEAIAIIEKTNRTSGYPNPDDPRHGMGWFAAYAGIQEVVGLSALNVGTVDMDDVTLRVERGNLLIGNPSGQPLAVEIYSPSGLMVERSTFSDTLGVCNLSHLPKGVYLIRAASQTLKIAI